ncbi:hypothetical protein J2X84_002386 [Pseudomonas corrugata]|uniref:hypothetical protein n=1 Tax=Pseudomonas corrugata TaxID=47879 RepID=UPI00286754F4|nr:hypothetical protein [Pseudomonas corrugata]MDR7283557.1 hypothetical protein [Pseudomonas corrugata]
MHQGSSLKGDVATVTIVGSIWHSTSERLAERDKHFASADFQNFPVNSASARDTTGSILDADFSLSIDVRSSATFLDGFGE